MAEGRDPLTAARDAAQALGWSDEQPDIPELIEALTDQLERALQQDPALTAAFASLLELHELMAGEASEEQRRRNETLNRIHDGLARLRSEPPEKLLERSTRALCEACGFDRGVLFRVSGSKLMAESVYVEGDPDWAARLLAASKADPVPLDAMVVETEALRRRRPVLINDALNHPGVYQPLAQVYMTTSYVCAPIIPEGRVIGFLHADQYIKGRAVDEFDRDACFAFAEGFGFVFERAVLLERLRTQGAEVRTLLASTEAVVRAYAEAEVELVRAADAEVDAARAMPTRFFAQRETGLAEQLTRREREVLRLLAAGATNSDIAEKLVVSEGTVKSHVRRILRRLKARNRVEAASIYHRLTSGDTPDQGS